MQVKKGKKKDPIEKKILKKRDEVMYRRLDPEATGIVEATQ